MERKGIFKEFITYSSLNVFSMIGLSCYILADTFFVAKRLGPDGLTALNIAIPLFSLIQGSGLMLGMGGAIRYNIFRSRGNTSGGNAAFTHSIVMAACLAAVYLIMGTFFVKPISYLLGANAQIAAMTQTYIRVLFFFSPAFLINNIMQSFVRNDGKPQLAMAAMVSGSLSNIVFDYILMFVFNMDILGAVVATGFSPVVSMIVISPYLIKRKNNFRLKKCKPSAKIIKNILSGGLPSLVTELSSGVVIIVFNMFILRLEGNIGVAAYGVIANLSVVVVSIYTGIAQGIQPIVSKYYAVGNEKNVRSILKYAIIAVTFLSVIIYAVVFFKADFITELFNDSGSEKLAEIAEYGLKLYFIGCIFAGINIVLSSFFISADKPKPANIITFARGFVVIIPITAVLAFIGKMTGLWLAFPVAEFLVSIVGYSLLVLNNKRSMNA